MSAPRRLWVRMRSVAPAHREAYRAAVCRAGAEAEACGAHFWAFEADGDGCVEFLEGPDDAALAGLHGRTAAALEEAAGGARPRDASIEAGGLRCTEIAGE